MAPSMSFIWMSFAQNQNIYKLSSEKVMICSRNLFCCFCPWITISIFEEKISRLLSNRFQRMHRHILWMNHLIFFCLLWNGYFVFRTLIKFNVIGKLITITSNGGFLNAQKKCFFLIWQNAGISSFFLMSCPWNKFKLICFKQTGKK